MTGKASDEEAAWRELVAQFGTPAADESAPIPWPPSEDLPGLESPRSPGAKTTADSPGATAAGVSEGGQARADFRDGDSLADPPGTLVPAGAENSADSRDGDSPANSPDGQTPTEPTGAPTPAEPPDAETPAGLSDLEIFPDSPGTSSLADPVAAAAADSAMAEPPTEPPVTEMPAGAGPVPGVIPAPPQFRIIRPALPSPLPDNDDEERYVPPVPPPLPQLDPAAKLAWAALFGGPGYLLVAVVAGWQVSGVAGLIAIAAFVGGFATLIMRMGDRPPGDSGPDDGAVV